MHASLVFPARASFKGSRRDSQRLVINGPCRVHACFYEISLRTTRYKCRHSRGYAQAWNKHVCPNLELTLLPLEGEGEGASLQKKKRQPRTYTTVVAATATQAAVSFCHEGSTQTQAIAAQRLFTNTKRGNTTQRDSPSNEKLRETKESKTYVGPKSPQQALNTKTGFNARA